LGIVVTHRIAGPVYRIQQQLERTLQGEKVGPIRLRRGDEFHKFAEIINQVLERCHQPEQGEQPEQDKPPEQDEQSEQGESSEALDDKSIT
jgi:hypothetical protein